jgi:hypothetical protein
LAIERGNTKETEGKIDWESYCLNWLVQAAGERKGRRQESRLRRQAGEAEGKKKGRGREEADRWDPAVSESKEKEKESGGVDRRGEGLVGCWAAWAER